jgi:hypothetical protein
MRWSRCSGTSPSIEHEENHGKFLFSAPPPAGGFGCFVCHQGEGFLAVTVASNGLDAEVTDRGLAAVTDNPNHEGAFKVQ